MENLLYKQHSFKLFPKQVALETFLSLLNYQSGTEIDRLTHQRPPGVRGLDGRILAKQGLKRKRFGQAGPFSGLLL